MRKKFMYLCILMVFIFVNIFSIASASGDTTIFKFNKSNQENFKISMDKGTGLDWDGDYITCKSSEYANFYLEPKMPIPVNKLNLKIKYKLLFETDNDNVDYIAIRAYGVDKSNSTAYTIIRTPKNNQVYEDEVVFNKFNVSTNATAFTVGSQIAKFRIDCKNINGANVKVKLEYLEVVEPEIDNSPPQFVSAPSGVDYINSLNLEIAKAKPGDTITIKNGTYSNCKFAVNSNGTKDAPITIKAETPGEVLFTGTSTLLINGSYNIIDGVLFKDGFGTGVITFNDSSSFCRLTNSAIINYNGIDLSIQSKWCVIKGKNNTVDHCYFREKTTMGNMLEVIRTNDDSNNHVIDRCYFGYFYPGTANGYEAVRIGTSTYSLSASNSVVKNCFFERCDGEAEIVSNKSCGNTYLNNTFYDCQGALTLRHGDYCTVEGNLFIGGKQTPRTTGVRVIGEKHKVFNNYFYNLPVTSTSVTIENGVPGFAVASYGPVKELDFHNNTFIGNDLDLRIGAYNAASDNPTVNRIAAPEGKVYNNAFYTLKGLKPIMQNEDPKHKLSFENNLVYGKNIGYQGDLPSGIAVGKFDYESLENGFYKTPTGADLEVIKKSPINPTAVAPAWITAKFGYKFETVAVDPFNSKITSTWDPILDVLILGIDTPYAYSKINKIPIDEQSDKTAPFTVSGRTMVPVRFISEQFNTTVTWDEATSKITIDLNTLIIADKKKIELVIGSNDMFINGEKIELDSPPVLVEGRTYLPLRACVNALDKKVFWDDRGIIVVTSNDDMINLLNENSELVNEFAKVLNK